MNEWEKRKRNKSWKRQADGLSVRKRVILVHTQNVLRMPEEKKNELV